MTEPKPCSLDSTESSTPSNPAVERLKDHARRWLRAARAAKPEALRRLAGDPEARELAPEQLQHKHALSAVSRRLGFRSWMHAQRVLRGLDEPDLGTLLVPSRCGGFTNHWYARHDEAAVGRAASGGYLLGYRRDCLVVTDAYVELLGLDPRSPAWEAIQYDWVRPADLPVRAELYAQLIERELS